MRWCHTGCNPHRAAHYPQMAIPGPRYTTDTAPKITATIIQGIDKPIVACACAPPEVDRRADLPGTNKMPIDRSKDCGAARCSIAAAG